MHEDSVDLATFVGGDLASFLGGNKQLQSEAGEKNSCEYAENATTTIESWLKR